MIVPLTSAFTPRSHYDVCIVGAGPAGIALALALAARGRSVFLAEGGDREFTGRSQDCYEGTVVGDPYFPLGSARMRFLGGTSNHWGGWCRTLDRHDFLPKAACERAQWPIRLDDLAPYEAESRRVLEITAPKPDSMLPGSTTLKQVYFSQSPPTRFGTRYAADLERAEGIDLCLNCNFTGLRTGDETIRAAVFRNYDRVERVVAASAFVLACGCLESIRFLLHENRRLNGGLGNQGGAVGRYWMEHPTFGLGEFFLYPNFLGGGPFDNADLDPHGSVNRRWFVAPTSDFMTRTSILNCGVRLEPVMRDDLHRFVADLVCGSPGVLQPLLAGLGKDVRCAGHLHAAWEEEPKAENRVTLDTGTDAFGIPRIVLHWTKSALDRRTPREMALAVARYFAQQDLGRVRLLPWLLDDSQPWPTDDELAGYHHMGGTRMAARPADGVVDADCRVFGTPNLFIAGSSVFPAGGHANPTQTIVQLALRLADHLHDTLSTPVSTAEPASDASR